MEEQGSSKKIFIIAGIVVVIVIAIIIGLFLVKGNKGSATGTTSFGALFGNSGSDTPRGGKNTVSGGTTLGGGTDDSGGVTSEPLFRQLSTVQTAGAIAVEKDGRTYVRYIARENGFVYDVDPTSGASVLLSNTTIPRIYEAFWANNGSTVVVRYLKHDDLARKDIIKTQIANLILPIGGVSSSSTDTGSLSISDPQLPDNISSVSVSANGAKLFYLLPVADGVSGTIVNITSKIATEVFRNSFSEWLPQILNNGNVILTSKASADVLGYAYLYDSNKKTLTRLLREKNGLTTLTTPDGGRMLYSENILKNTTLGLYSAKGFEQDEGDLTHTATLQLATLPEKCAWSKNYVRAYCGAFASTPSAQIPDDWYQGALAFSDTFWTMNTDLADLVFLADPKIETGKTFDVFMPFVDKGENYFYFIDKNDATLWSMRLEKSKFTTIDELPISTSSEPILTPEEMKDAVGSMPSKVVATTTPKKAKIK
jgi:hypothetical protein